MSQRKEGMGHTKYQKRVMNQIRNLALMFQDPEGALCSCLTQTDLTSPKFLTDYRPAHGLDFGSSVARKWKNTGYLFQTSEQQPGPFETECRLHLTGQSVSETKSKPAEEKTQARSSVLSKAVPSVIPCQWLENCCVPADKGVFPMDARPL